MIDNLTKKQRAALEWLAEKAVRFANTMDAHGEAWDTETGVLNAAIDFASTLSKKVRDTVGCNEP